MQKWEYKSFKRTRGAAPTRGEHFHRATGWSDGEDLEELGEQGWELVSIVPRSGFMGDAHSGFTSEELWVFKLQNLKTYCKPRGKEKRSLCRYVNSENKRY